MEKPFNSSVRRRTWTLGSQNDVKPVPTPSTVTTAPARCFPGAFPRLHPNNWRFWKHRYFLFLGALALIAIVVMLEMAFVIADSEKAKKVTLRKATTVQYSHCERMELLGYLATMAGQWNLAGASDKNQVKAFHLHFTRPSGADGSRSVANPGLHGPHSNRSETLNSCPSSFTESLQAFTETCGPVHRTVPNTAKPYLVPQNGNYSTTPPPINADLLRLWDCTARYLRIDFQVQNSSQMFHLTGVCTAQYRDWSSSFDAVLEHLTVTREHTELLLHNASVFDLPPSSTSPEYFSRLSARLLAVQSREGHLLFCQLQQLEGARLSSGGSAVRIIILVMVLLILLPVLSYWNWKRLREETVKLTNQLQEAIASRRALKAEKMCADNLLLKLYPESVAQSLIKFIPIQPETFDSVTVYFSDIVGFKEQISAISTPLEVVAFLNALYTKFDNRIDFYDVYKVETIGDAYMLVSGLPRRNGRRHAGEIATLALDFQHLVWDFQIPHMPGQKLLLRIGFHSGMVMAGVVGLKMPRYCLFGDAVNTASRMESTGEELKIHLSEASKVLLDELGGYYVEYRGETQVKGKNVMKTYWLTGKEDLHFDTEKEGFCTYRER
ncbi:uncharacterized protein LOC129598097 [Paramacrobiotus metropolitanus]|uniref:uncharacterized protein LOC129598097 n=1 Tax=Paramacrobiotus metropolitanus TaxID=2943436 RepID=UPI002445C5D7|nr:uncharacterized protein LOC129598097 [Paramacrobiotus metropolitanus]